MNYMLVNQYLFLSSKPSGVLIKIIADKILATNTTLNTKINEVKGEILSIANIAATATPNTKINEVESKIPSITNLATTTVLTAVEKKLLHYKTIIKKLVKLKINYFKISTSKFSKQT